MIHVLQPVQPHTFYARLLAFDKTLAQSFCSCELLWRSGEGALFPCFNVQPDIFAVMNCCVAALSLFSCDILTWSADSLYSVQWHINKRSACRRICLLRQIVTSQNAHTKCKWPPYATEWNTPRWKFSACAIDCSSGLERCTHIHVKVIFSVSTVQWRIAWKVDTFIFTSVRCLHYKNSAITM